MRAAPESAELPVALVPEPRTALCEALVDRLRAADYAVVSRADRPLDLLVAPIAPRDTPEATAEGVFDAIELLRGCRATTGALPRRTVALVHAGVGADDTALRHLARSLTRTLLVYLTAHTIHEDARINAVHVPGVEARVVASSLDLVIALSSGLLDGVRGQLFEVGAA